MQSLKKGDTIQHFTCILTKGLSDYTTTFMLSFHMPLNLDCGALILYGTSGSGHRMMRSIGGRGTVIES